jgi:sec-independent protein translocase protein TatB
MSFALIFESVGGTEWLVLLGVVLIVVGPKNLPSAARKLGSVMSKLRRAADEFKRQIMSMDEEFRKTVDDAAAGVVSDSPSSDDPSTVPDSEDRAEEEGSAYDYDSDSPYPGHDYYDDAENESAEGENELPAEEPPAEPAPPPPAAEPEKPKPDPYAIKITVTTAADGKGGRR